MKIQLLIGKTSKKETSKESNKEVKEAVTEENDEDDGLDTKTIKGIFLYLIEN